MRVFTNSDFWVFRRGEWDWRVGSVLKMNGDELMCFKLEAKGRMEESEIWRVLSPFQSLALFSSSLLISPDFEMG